MAEYAPHIKHYSKVYFVPVHPDGTELTTIAANVDDIVTPAKAAEVQEALEEYAGCKLRPATPAEIEEHEESDNLIHTEV